MKAFSPFLKGTRFPSGRVARAHYVDQTLGSDGNNGTETTAPIKTIARINTKLFRPADTISFKRGEVWAERLTVPSSGTFGNEILFTAYGSGALPNFTAASGRAECFVVPSGKDHIKMSFIKCSGGDAASASALFENAESSNVTVEDCEFDGGTTLADSCISGNGDSHTVVRRCLITNARDDGFTLHSTASALLENVTFTGNRSAINNSGTAMSIIGNDLIFENNGNGADSNFGDLTGLSVGTFVFNRCRFKGRTDGLDMSFVLAGEAGENITLNYCIIDNHRGASAPKGTIAASNGSVINLNNCVLRGNTGGDGVSGSMNGVSGATITLKNTILSYWWRILASGGTVNSDYGLFHAVYTMGTITSNTNQVSTSDPLFVGPTTGDFHLQAGSPAINAGIAIAGLTLDFYGAAVGNPPEVGVAEYP